jgi:hypothetical protein
MPRIADSATLGAVMLAWMPGPLQGQSLPQDRKPVVAVMSFTNAALTEH